MTRQIAALAGIVWLFGGFMGCAGQTGKTDSAKGDGHVRANPRDVSITCVGTSMVFFDRDTGNLWVYADPEKPAELIGRLDSFDKPLVAGVHERQMAGNVVTDHASPPPAVAKGHDDRTLSDKLNALPRNLWPTEDENQVKRETRDKWLKDNVKPGLGTFTGTVTSVSTTGEGKVTARLEVQKASIWGKEIPLHLTATFDGVDSGDVIIWKVGQTMTVRGLVKEANPEESVYGGYAYVTVLVENAKVK